MTLEIKERENSVVLTEIVSVEDVKGLFLFPEHYQKLVSRLGDQSQVYVHIFASGVTGEVRVLGVSVEPNGIETREISDVIGKGAIPFLEGRMDDISESLTSYKPPKLYAVDTHPIRSK